MLTFPDHTYLPFPILRVERICITIKLRSQEIIQVLNQAYMLHSYLQGDCKWRVSSDAENTLKNRLAQPPLLFHKQDRAVRVEKFYYLPQLVESLELKTGFLHSRLMTFLWHIGFYGQKAPESLSNAWGSILRVSNQIKSTKDFERLLCVRHYDAIWRRR